MISTQPTCLSFGPVKAQAASLAQCASVQGAPAQEAVAQDAVDSDWLVFAEEEPAEVDGESIFLEAWKILLVDDDPDVHQATKVALKFFTFENRPLLFLSAYSTREAKQLIDANPDVALVLLDVIMESQDSGLQIAKYIREELKNEAVRIVLRTGQPGQVPEEKVIVNYDINDYKTKVELTQKKLFTTTVASLRAYRGLMALAESQAALEVLNTQLKVFNRTLEQQVSDRTRSLTHEVEEREKAEEALKLYIHALTHDLRNPVTGMTTVLQSLLECNVSGEPPSASIPMTVLERMSAGCERQLQMINSLLETRTIELWGVSLQPTFFSLSAMVRAIVESWQQRIGKKRVQVVLQLSDDLPEIEGDRTQLWRVFDNLIDNAIKYNPPGITLTVSTRLLASGEIRCIVADNGVGIRPQQIDRLFKLYQRGSIANSMQGLGLGLYICQCIVQAHGSNISATSELGSGTQFWFDLPQQLPAASLAAPPLVV